MRALIQRVTEASVEVEGNVVGQIHDGLLILLGIESEDGQEDIEWLTKKVTNLRIFSDEGGKMNRSIQDKGGSFLVISQFTLHASTRKGNRPSYIRAAPPDVAIPLYEQFVKTLAVHSGLRVETGEFGAYMKVRLLNDGPVTIWMDTKDKE
jgi:D-tyrosyl-tRNA(Tyr) deacylase